MSLKTEWRLNELLLGSDADDPFEDVILSSGLRVDLTGTEDEVFAGLRQSLALEGTLFEQGVTCELKEGGQDCLTCPLYAGDRPEEARAPLCRLGRDQRVMEERCNKLSHERRAPFIELAEVYTEPVPEREPDFDELLVAAGF